MIRNPRPPLGQQPRLRESALALFGALVLSQGSLANAKASEQRAAPDAQSIVEPQDANSFKRLRVLTTQQYLNTLAYVFGPDIEPAIRFAPPQRADGLLASGTSLAGVTFSQVEMYQKAAATVAALIIDPKRRDFLIGCKPKSEKTGDKACATKFITRTGRLLYRRTLAPEKVKQLVNQAGEAADELKGFYPGLGVAIEAMLLSPGVVLVGEASEPDPKRPGMERLDGYSLASRLSLFLWDAAPDDALLKAAETGEIHTEAGRTRVVDRMLASPRLKTGMRAFFDDMFVLDQFDVLTKDALVYPSFTAETVADAREQTLRTVIDHLIDKQRDYRDLYTSRETFISPALAALYRLPARMTWTPYEFPEESYRVGLLTQISFLAGHSHPGRSSPTLRGKALREVLLCQRVPPPPPSVDFSALENPDAHYRTARERIGAHNTNPVCAGCHKITDPMGLALENFDGAGQFRKTEKGAPIDTSGSLDGKPFNDPAGLGQALREHPALPTCLVKRVYAYGAGGATVSGDKEILDYLNKTFAAEGYRLPELLRAIALSQAFSTVRKHVENPVATSAGLAL